MSEKHGRVCPVAFAGSLDNRIRRWFHNPHQILAPYVKEGMTVLDLGCGPGFFSIDLAMMVGNFGRVFAVDLQEGMLLKLRNKINGTKFEKIITLHKCDADKIGISDPVDFALAFYMIHEVPDPTGYFKEIHSILYPGGLFLIAEPKLLHVSKKAFTETLRKVQDVGFEHWGEPKIFLSWSAVFKKII